MIRTKYFKESQRYNEKELELLPPNQRKFVCEYFKESYEVLGINVNVQ